MRDQYRVGGEIKSRKVSPSRLDFYKALIDLFFEQGPDLRYRSIVLDSDRVDLTRHHEGSAELSFYKFYYQLLHHWLNSHNSYQIFCDYQTNQHPNRLAELHRVLDNAWPLADFKTVQWVRSKESVLTQFSDVLTGLCSARFNATPQEGSAKAELLRHFEARLGHPISATGVNEQKFNVFKINLQGGWPK